jgi:pimeloyl-ACP methyl ester carboxylesterase
MQALILVPGIMGTELFDGQEKLWPPKPLETKFGYGRVEQLMKPDLKVGQIIRKVLCVGIYEDLFDQLEALGYTEDGADQRLYTFPYDWRQDLEVLAQQLAARLAQAQADGAQDIIIVAHSMGGLISRLVLEGPQFRAEPWFANIKMFLALGTPHRGAPLALARVLGLDSAMGISQEDFKRFSANVAYPSAYQLLPAPGEDCCWDVGQAQVTPVDIHDPAMSAALGLSAPLMARARYVHDTFQSGARPKGVRYFSFAGTGHETVTRVNIDMNMGALVADQMVVTRTKDAGDGTVPFWSSLLPDTQRHVAINDHTTVFTGDAFKRVFFRLLGVDLGAPVQGFGNEAVGFEAEHFRLSTPQPIVRARQAFEVVIQFGKPTRSIKAELLLQSLTEGGVEEGSAEEHESLNYSGPPIENITVQVSGIADPGLYELRMVEGAHQASIKFAVMT